MRRVPQNIRNYFTNYTKRLTPNPVPMDSKQLGDALRNARNQNVSGKISNRDENHEKRVQDRGITALNSHNENSRVQVGRIRSVSQTNCTKVSTPRGITNESAEKKSGRMKESNTAKSASVPFTWFRKQRTLPTKSKYADAANQLLKRVNVNMYNVKWWAILDSGATSNF